MKKGCFLFYIMLIFVSCKNKNVIVKKAIIDNTDYVVSSIGFSSRGAKGYYKIKANVHYYIGKKRIENSVILSKKFGFVEINDTLKISLSKDKPKKIKVVSVVPKNIGKNKRGTSSLEAIDNSSSKQH